MEKRMVSPELPMGISVGSSITIGNYVVPQAISQFHRKYPACEVTDRIQNSQQIVQAVLKNGLDIGLVEDKVDYEQLNSIPFMQDQLYFICGRDHPLAGQRSVSLEEISRNFPEPALELLLAGIPQVICNFTER